MPAITNCDVAAKQRLQFLVETNSSLHDAKVPSGATSPSPPFDLSKYREPVSDNPGAAPNQTSSSRRADVPLANRDGLFVVPVEINGAITLEFGVDSGALMSAYRLMSFQH